MTNPKTSPSPASLRNDQKEKEEKTRRHDPNFDRDSPESRTGQFERHKKDGASTTETERAGADRPSRAKPKVGPTDDTPPT